MFLTTEACPTTVYDLVYVQYRRYSMELRRGVSSHVATKFFQDYVYHLTLFVSGIQRYPSSFGATCLSIEQYEEFSSFYDLNKFDKHIFLLNHIESNVFYLPHKTQYYGYSDKDLLPFSIWQENRMHSRWLQNRLELGKNPLDVRRIRIRLRGGIDIFFDPFSERVCKNFQNYVNPSDETITADKLILEVTAIVIRLHLLGIPEDESLQLLRHASSFVFNGIRCRRRNNANLYVSRVFYPAYYQAFAQLTKDVDRDAVPPIPMYVIKRHVENEVKLLSFFRGWGRIDFFTFEGDKLVYRNIGNRIFLKKILDGIQSDMGTTARNFNNTIENVVRDDDCEDPYYWDDNLKGCCGTICKNTKLLQSAGSLDRIECCKICNSISCRILESPLKELMTVCLEKYGYSEFRSISILI